MTDAIVFGAATGTGAGTAVVSRAGPGWEGFADGAPGAAPRPSFDDLLDRHSTEIYRYACHLTRNCADADDLYQDTMLKAYRAFGRLDDTANGAKPHNYRAWLYKIATNTFLGDRRKLGREHPIDDALEATLPAVALDHAAGLDARDLLSEVSAFVAALPRKQRVALVLRKFHEAGYAEIAASLNCSEDAARANVHEALRKLRHGFGDRL